MRFLVPALALLAAPLASAQADLALPIPPTVEAEHGVFAEAGGGFGHLGARLGAYTAAETSIGYRLPSGLAVGGHLSAYRIGDSHTGLAIGPEVRYRHALSERTLLDVHASGTLGLYSGELYDDASLRATGVGTQVGATATRRFDLGGGVRLAAVGGLEGGVTRAFDRTVGGVERDGRTEAYAAVVAGAQVEFKALGGQFAIGPVLALPVVQTGRDGFSGFESYRTGGGPSRSFITFRF